MINWILRPLMPPASLISSKRIFTALEDETPYVAATPDRSVCMPSTISVLVTPRVCADASVATAASAATATIISFGYIVLFLLSKAAQFGPDQLSSRLYDASAYMLSINALYFSFT